MQKIWETSAVLVAKDGVELENGLFFLRGELPSLDIGPQVVRPSQPAALAAPVQSCDTRLDA
jgi:hypothetical protein